MERRDPEADESDWRETEVRGSVQKGFQPVVVISSPPDHDPPSVEDVDYDAGSGEFRLAGTFDAGSVGRVCLWFDRVTDAG